MLNFGRLLSFPLTYKHLNDKLGLITVQDIQTRLDNNVIHIFAIANNHEVHIDIFNNRISSDTPVKVYCNCDFFKYNLAYSLLKNDGLLFPENFTKLFPPKSKNPGLSLSGCKHIILIAKTIWINRNIIKG